MEKDSSKKKHKFLGSSEVSLNSKDASQKMIRDGCLEVSKNDKGQLVFKGMPTYATLFKHMDIHSTEGSVTSNFS